MTTMLPMSEIMLSGSLTLYSKVSVIVSSFVGFIFIIRCSLLVASIGRTDQYVELLKNVVMYFGLSQLFPYFVRTIVGATAKLSQSIAFVPSQVSQDSIKGFFDRMFGEFVVLRVMGSIGDVIVLGLSNAFYSTAIGLIFCIAPVVIFLNTMLGISQGVKVLIGIFLSLCLWPTLWNLLGLLGNEVSSSTNSSPVATASFWVVIQILQCLSPLFCLFLFKSLSADGAITQMAKKGVKVVGGKWI